MKYVKVSRNHGVESVILNRADKRNAFDAQMIEEVTEVFTQLNKDKKLRAVLLTGEGKSFCAGGDIEWMKSMASYTPKQNLRDAEKLFAMFWAVRSCPVPVLGRVFGHCFGGGAGLTAACDIVAAETETLLSYSEVKIGLVPAVISPFVMERVPPAKVNEWFMTGKIFRANEALQAGLIHHAGDLASVDKYLDETLMNIANSAPEAVRETKKLIRSYSTIKWSTAKSRVTKLIAQRRASAEGQKGLKAFLEKQNPNWSESLNANAPAKI